MITIEVKLVSQYRHHGSAGPKPTRVRSRASAKLTAMLLQDRAQRMSTNANDKVQSGDSGIKKDPKPYGSHGGNIQVDLLKRGEINDDNVTEYNRYVQNVTAYLESLQSFDLKAAKFKYRVYKDNVVMKYYDQFGEDLSEVQTTNMLTELAQEAFLYTSHQIVITLSSEEYFEGSSLNTKDKRYYATIKSKMVYSEGRKLLAATVRDNMRSMEFDTENVILTNTVRTSAIITFDKVTQRPRIQYPGIGAVKVGGQTNSTS